MLLWLSVVWQLLISCPVLLVAIALLAVSCLVQSLCGFPWVWTPRHTSGRAVVGLLVLPRLRWWQYMRLTMMLCSNPAWKLRVRWIVNR